MNRAMKRERARRVRQACIRIAQWKGELGALYNPQYLAREIKKERRGLFDAWRMGHGRLPASLANYRYKVAKRHERAMREGVSFGRGSYHRHDVW